jgi:hypothetical protein
VFEISVNPVMHGRIVFCSVVNPQGKTGASASRHIVKTHPPGRDVTSHQLPTLAQDLGPGLIK